MLSLRESIVSVSLSGGFGAGGMYVADSCLSLEKTDESVEAADVSTLTLKQTSPDYKSYRFDPKFIFYKDIICPKVNSDGSCNWFNAEYKSSALFDTGWEPILKEEIITCNIGDSDKNHSTMGLQLPTFKPICDPSKPDISQK